MGIPDRCVEKISEPAIPEESEQICSLLEDAGVDQAIIDAACKIIEKLAEDVVAMRDRRQESERATARLRAAAWRYLRSEYPAPEELIADKNLPEIDWPARDFYIALQSPQSDLESGQKAQIDIVGELINTLSKVDPNRVVILQRDVAGNSHVALYGAYEGSWEPVEPGSQRGKAGLERLTDEDRKKGFTEEDIVSGQPALILYPCV